MSERILPLLIAALMACAAVPYIMVGDWRRSIYWLAASAINVVVTV